MEPFSEYQLFIEHIHELNERRQNVTTTYLSVNSAIVGAIVIIFAGSPLQDWGKQLSALGLLLAGILACDFWRRLITHYGKLLSWWYGQIREIEASLPGSHQLITKEFNDLYAPSGRLTSGLSHYEVRLTWLFTLIYLISIVALLALLVLAAVI